ncbi:ATP-NAD kinase family protein [Vagococcus sp. BWB3-3]|uniref:ATP-NAD kinase family protein n=1 Tax=Vagococcus allomyrinae TaxID=2794353 RepID=A0A940PB41_9ENTE|nr:ATP-NAD kinase family protein [Vagococcus allomyrinae]MBP1044587.1 ATP-NAD kinase family protein [Vagococcus allomyrinae]
MKIGLIINPIAGVGGPAGLKGSDGAEIQELALYRGSTFQSAKKVKIALEALRSVEISFELYTGAGELGEEIVKELGFPCQVFGSKKSKTTSQDTEDLAKVLAKQVELLVFAGGDGTARNIYHAVGLSIPCVGIPTGVKIHSAVYGNSPKAAGQLIARFINHPESAQLVEREVMDIDEEKFRQEIIEARLYGYLEVPYVSQLMQPSKASVKFSEYDVMGIADEIADRMKKLPTDTCFLFGTGGTTFKVMAHLGFSGSLLGVDVVINQAVVIKDATEKALFDLLRGRRVVLILTVIGGQGHILGRGNQQISPRIVRDVLPSDIWIVSTAAKIYHLPNHALRVDTSDWELDQQLAGYWKVIVGWQEQIVCPIV